MNRSRLAAAAGAAAITLGATVAAATGTTDSDTQTVTITVTAAPRTITTSGAAGFTLGVGSDASEAEPTGTPQVTYENPLEGAAQIRVAATKVDGNVIGTTVGVDTLFQLWTDAFGGQVFHIEAKLAGETTPRKIGVTFADQIADNGGMMLADVPGGTSSTTKDVEYNLVGTAPTEPTGAEGVDIELTFTIEDKPSS